MGTSSILEEIQAELDRERRLYTQIWQRTLFRKIIEAVDTKSRYVLVALIPVDCDMDQPQWWQSLPEDSLARITITWLVEEKGVPTDALIYQSDRTNETIKRTKQVDIDLNRCPSLATSLAT